MNKEFEKQFAVLRNIHTLTAAEFEITEEQYAFLLAAQRNGTRVEITCEDAVVVDAEGDFENNYHDILFQDGETVFNGLSGFHLTKVV